MRIDRKKARLAMARKGVRFVDLEKAVPHGTLVHALGGKRNCRPATAGKIADALGVDVTEILTDDSI